MLGPFKTNTRTLTFGHWSARDVQPYPVHSFHCHSILLYFYRLSVAHWSRVSPIDRHVNFGFCFRGLINCWGAGEGASRPINPILQTNATDCCTLHLIYNRFRLFVESDRLHTRSTTASDSTHVQNQPVITNHDHQPHQHHTKTALALCVKTHGG